jgi:hypothetical protein
MSTVFSQSKGYYSKKLFERYKHEYNIGIGISSCQTDVGGSNFSAQELNDKFGGKIFRTIYDTDILSSNFVLNAGYTYRFNEKIRFRGNLIFSRISGDDSKTDEFYRKNRNLNFRTDILELSAMTEYHIVRANTGSKHNLRNPQGKRISPKWLYKTGFYLVGGVGGFLYVPKAKNNFSYQQDITSNTNFTDAGYEFETDNTTYHKLRPLHTEGQGYEGIESGDDFNIPSKEFNEGKTYKKVAVCIPFGFGIQQAFDSYMGIKIEFGIRYTFTDYLDDVSGIYYDKNLLAQYNGNVAATMSGTNSGITSGDVTYTEAGYKRGNPNNNDYYGFLNISLYKTFVGNSNWFKSMNLKQKRKIRRSF